MYRDNEPPPGVQIGNKPQQRRDDSSLDRDHVMHTCCCHGDCQLPFVSLSPMCLVSAVLSM